VCGVGGVNKGNCPSGARHWQGKVPRLHAVEDTKIID